MPPTRIRTATNASSSLYRIDTVALVPCSDYSVILTVSRMRGWIRHLTSTSPAVVKVTEVDVPGVCEPRLNSFPALDDETLWVILSSLTNTTTSPRLISRLATENVRPFCPTIYSLAY